MILYVAWVAAVPAKRGIWRTATLGDGTEMKLELRGDELTNYWQATDGSRWVEDTLTGHLVRADIPSMMQKRKERKEEDAALALKKTKRSAKTPPYEGLKKGLIVLVQYNDVRFRPEDTKELYNRIANERNFSNEMGFKGSLKDSFLAQSYGKMEFDFDIAGPVTLSQNASFYRKGAKPDKNMKYFLSEALKLADKEVRLYQV